MMTTYVKTGIKGIINNFKSRIDKKRSLDYVIIIASHLLPCYIKHLSIGVLNLLKIHTTNSIDTKPVLFIPRY